ncbi:type III CRISPR-associated RAMP protein Csx7 [Thermocladium modestius]|uniref:type III CRISPR-associated RAMP protein Csx7 n=1 Tax=Thermocladium modestius TaxID=62609 RepID=UPI00166F3BDD|nr:CRISPR-associated RAMP protein Csx7 [Thermocladium modestius]
MIRKDILARRVKIYGKIETLAPLRIGKGREETNPESAATMQIIRTYDEKPLIPGSSWKGIFRSTGEKIAKENRIFTCTGLTRQTCMDKILSQVQSLMSKNIDEAIKLVWDETCINCKIFGAPSLYSAISIFDSIAEKFNIGYRPMIAISRDTGAVTRSALATTEYVEPGSIFPFLLIGNNLPNYAIGYIIKIMRYINDGLVQIGGNKSRGFGFITFSKLSLEISDYKDGKLKAIDDLDKEITIDLPKDSEGKDFFVKTKPLEEVFNNAKI